MTNIRTISLIDIARSESFGPITPDSRLSDFANEIGPPARWAGFEDERRLRCFMVFGEVEVGFIADEGDLLVTWAKISMAKFWRGYLKFGHNIDRGVLKDLRIHNPFGATYPHYDLVAERMAQAGLKYATDINEPVAVDTSAVMRFGPVKFYFSNRPGQPLEVINL
jgi:hypothetical protein